MEEVFTLRLYSPLKAIIGVLIGIPVTTAGTFLLIVRLLPLTGPLAFCLCIIIMLGAFYLASRLHNWLVSYQVEVTVMSSQLLIKRLSNEESELVLLSELVAYRYDPYVSQPGLRLWQMSGHKIALQAHENSGPVGDFHQMVAAVEQAIARYHEETGRVIIRRKTFRETLLGRVFLGVVLAIMMMGGVVELSRSAVSWVHTVMGVMILTMGSWLISLSVRSKQSKLPR